MTEHQAPAMLPDGRMTTKDAARYLGLAAKTLAMWRTAGKGPRFVKRGRVFYYRADCDDWLQGGRVTSTAQARQLEADRLPAAMQATVAVEKVNAAPTRAPGKRGAQRKTVAPQLAPKGSAPASSRPRGCKHEPLRRAGGARKTKGPGC